MAKNNFIDAESIVKSLTEAFLKHEKAIEESATALNRLQKEYSKLPSDYIKAQKEILDLNIKRSRAEKEVQNALNAKSRAEAAATRTTEVNRKAIEAQNKAYEREQQKLAAATNLYSKTQQQLNKVTAAYNDLAVRKERYNNLTAQEEQRMATLQRVSEKYNTTLKAVDATVGKHTRNVGNYSSAFNPLSNSINQLTREMPAFTYSVQTGFMAISNNLPILFDAMGNVIAQNKQLQAEGKPTQSVLKQVAGALFSFQTLLGVGITLLTVYGKEIGNWISDLMGASSALDELNKRQKEFSEAKFQGKKDAQSEIIELRKYLAVVKDRNVSDEERNIALKALRSQYPFYFKELTDEQILNGKSEKSVKALTTALEKRKEVEKKTELNVLNKQKLLDLNKELEVQQKIIKQSEQSISNGVKQNASARSLAFYSDQLRAAKKRESEILVQTNAITEKMIKNDSDIFKLKKETIGLEYQQEKNGKERIKNLKELTLETEDYIASQYKLNRLQLELEIKSAEDIYNKEGKLFSERENAYKVMVEKKIALAQLDYNEQVRLENKRVADGKKAALEEYNETIKQEGATASLKARAKHKLDSYLYSLDLQSKYNLEELELQHTNNVLEVWEGFYDKLNELTIKQRTQGETKRINEQELNDLRQYNTELLNITKKTTSKRLDEIEKLKTDSQKSAQRQRLELDLQNINDRLDKENEFSDKWYQINLERIEKQKQLNDLQLAENEKLAAEQKKYLDDIKSYLGSFVNDFASQSGMPTLFKALNNKITGFGENASVTMLAVTEIFQEAFNLMNSQSEAYFNAQFDRLERQKNLAVKYAGESSTAREEIERQYEERRKEIERRRAEQQKRSAMFNIAVNTAQGITAALTSTPPNVPLSIAIGLIGAAQLAMVASQQIPAYAEGTLNHTGGAMLINDGKGNNYKETVVTPDGKAKQYSGRNVLTSAPKGTKVFTHEQWQEELNKTLDNNGIGYSAKFISPISIASSGITADELDRIFGKHFSGITQSVMNVDKNGFNEYIIKGGQKTQRVASRVSFKGLST